MNDKINLITSSNITVEANIICFLENITSGKRYLYYTLNETVGTGANSTVKVYVAKIRQNNPALDTMISEEEWKLLKDYMAEVLKSTPNNNIKYLSISELTDTTSVSERVIAMPVSYDYINKHRGVYAEAVVKQESTPIIEEKPEITLEPIVEESVPVAHEEVIEQPIPNEEPATQEPVVQEPVISETVVVEETPVVNEVEDTSNSHLNLKPINIDEIEQKYIEMIENINKLKAQEIEAAKRYNATIELSAMHNEQHANYVANEQTKETNETVNASAPIEPTPVTPIIPEPVSVEPSTPVDIETNWFDMPEQQ